MDFSGRLSNRRVHCVAELVKSYVSLNRSSLDDFRYQFGHELPAGTNKKDAQADGAAWSLLFGSVNLLLIGSRLFLLRLDDALIELPFIAVKFTEDNSTD